MFTKPSVVELLEGVSRTAEGVLMPAMADSPVAERVVEILMILDRIGVEWGVAAQHLAADNDDIRITLRGLGRSIDAGDPAADDGRPGSAEALAAQNSRLKGALVQAIDELDLPAGPDDPGERQAADRAVLDLLGRMLCREREASPAVPLRTNPLSRAITPLHEDEQQRFTDALEAFIAAEMPDTHDVKVSNLRLVAGGASREAFFFDVVWSSPDGSHAERCVLLRQPVSSVLESDESEDRITGSRRVPRNEFKMIRCMEAAGVPVPHMLWVDPTGGCMDRPFFVSRLIEGESDLSKLPTEPHLDKILDEYVQILAQVHGLDPAAVGVDFLGQPTRATAASEQVELFASGVERQRLEDFPALAYMIGWLRKHQPEALRVSVVHGDFRLGNFMWDADGIVAMLDWEQCHLGDPLEEIAFMYWHLWTLEPFIPLEEFVRRYEQASGTVVDREALAFYRVFIELKMAVVLLTGIKSYFATEERQLMYGSTMAFEMLRECQLRVIDELLTGGPTMAFDATARRG